MRQRKAYSTLWSEQWPNAQTWKATTKTVGYLNIHSIITTPLCLREKRGERKLADRPAIVQVYRKPEGCRGHCWAVCFRTQRQLWHPSWETAQHMPVPNRSLSVLTFNKDTLPVLVNCFSFSLAAALLVFPGWSGFLFSSNFLRFSFSFIFKRFWYFFFLRSRFLSVAVFSAVVFRSPALFFSY